MDCRILLKFSRPICLFLTGPERPRIYLKIQDGGRASNCHSLSLYSSAYLDYGQLHWLLRVPPMINYLAGYVCGT